MGSPSTEQSISTSPVSASSSNQYDEQAAAEALIAFDAFSALGILGAPEPFSRVCKVLDALMGYKTPCPPPSDVINDPIRGWYPYAVSYILRLTRLEIDELARVAERAQQVASDDERGGKGKGAAPSRQKDPMSAMLLLIAMARTCDFEPRWHMRRRGDDRELPNSKGKEMWRYLRDLYTDPERSRMRMPDNIKRLVPLYKGYEECVKAAVGDGHAELRRIYGDDVDLSPKVERRDKDNDYDGAGASFMKLLQRGGDEAFRGGTEEGD